MRQKGHKIITVDILRDMRYGSTKIFSLPDYAACLSNKQLAYKYAPMLNCKFEVKVDASNNSIAITKKQAV